MAIALEHRAQGTSTDATCLKWSAGSILRPFFFPAEILAWLHDLTLTTHGSVAFVLSSAVAISAQPEVLAGSLQKNVKLAVSAGQRKWNPEAFAGSAAARG